MWLWGEGWQSWGAENEGQISSGDFYVFHDVTPAREGREEGGCDKSEDGTAALVEVSEVWP